MQFILPYSVSKTALLGLVKALSHDIAQDNIRVNSVAPGLIDTSFSSAVSSNNKTAMDFFCQSLWGFFADNEQRVCRGQGPGKYAHQKVWKTGRNQWTCLFLVLSGRVLHHRRKHCRGRWHHFQTLKKTATVYFSLFNYSIR